jgi:hypothetical protein
MKKYFSLVLFLILICKCFAQKSFEGHIVYETYFKAKDSSAKFMDVFFKDEKICITLATDSKKSYKPTVFIYEFKKGISYDINIEARIILSDSLKKKYLASPFTYDSITNSSKEIKEFNCIKYNVLKVSERNPYLKNISSWFATDLKFPVQDSFRFIQPFFFLNGRTFSLETEIVMAGQNQINDTISIRAVTIENKNIDDSIFQLDKSYVIKDVNEFQKEMMLKFTPPKIITNDPKKNKRVEPATGKLKKTVKHR